jgi:hypothetical protein
MSKRDQGILERLDMRHAELARILGVTRQAATQGINQPNRDYLTPDRIRHVYTTLRETNQERAAILRDWAREREPDLVPHLDAAPPRTFPNLPEFTDFTELWIFSALPFELREHRYIGEMTKHLLSPHTVLAYFVPPGEVSEALQRLFADQEVRASLYIIETAAVLMMPHIAILGPRSTRPRTLALAPNGNFVEVSAPSQLLETLIRARIGLNPDDFVPRRSVSTSGLTFELVYSAPSGQTTPESSEKLAR